MQNFLAEATFAEVLEIMGARYVISSVDFWLGKAYISDFDGVNVTVTAENAFKRDVIINRYQQRLEDTLCEVMGSKVRVIVNSREDLGKEESRIFDKTETPSNTTEKETSEEENADNIWNGYTFDNFVVGSSNRVAQAACLNVASTPSTNINPLFIYGPSGLGKTHLLFAIINEVKKLHGKYNVLYVTGEQFTNEIIDAIASSKVPSANGTRSTGVFRDKYRSVDMLLVDDIQFIAGKMTVQEEFFYTFDTLYKLKKQIVLTSDRTPRDMDLLEERLRTRFESGLIVDIQPPDPELRTAIIKQKTQQLGLEVPNDVLSYIAENIDSNVRQIEGAIKKLWAQSFINRESISLDMAKAVLADYFKSTRPAITTDKIFSVLERRYAISREEMLGKRRTGEIVYARHIAIYLIQEYTDLSLKKTGKLFERDHTTIISARDSVIKRMKSDASFNREIMDIKEDLEKKK